MLRALPDIFNAVAKKFNNVGTRFNTESMTHVDTVTHEGGKFDCINLFNLSTANPLYVLFQLPDDTERSVELITRHFQTDTGGADLKILWDYDVDTSGGTVLTSFNECNLYRGVIDADFKVTILNSVTVANNVYTPTDNASSAISDEGIQREPSFITGTGLGANRAGGVNPDVGTRKYAPGTGFLVKITSRTNSNLTLLGYTWIENGCSQ